MHGLFLELLVFFRVLPEASFFNMIPFALLNLSTAGLSLGGPLYVLVIVVRLRPGDLFPVFVPLLGFFCLASVVKFAV